MSLNLGKHWGWWYFLPTITLEEPFKLDISDTDMMVAVLWMEVLAPFVVKWFRYKKREMLYVMPEELRVINEDLANVEYDMKQIGALFTPDALIIIRNNCFYRMPYEKISKVGVKTNYGGCGHIMSYSLIFWNDDMDIVDIEYKSKPSCLGLRDELYKRNANIIFDGILSRLQINKYMEKYKVE